jgi:hypothetical protein
MSRINGSVLMVGSIAGNNAEEVMRFCVNELGNRLSMIPDGETGLRKMWINYLAATIYNSNDALETVNQPEPVNPDDESEWREENDSWAPKGYHDHWQFRIKNKNQVHFEHLGYAKEAIASYAIFKQLREEGIISSDQRFMVAMPMCESAVRPFLGKAGAEDYDEFSESYTEAMSREIQLILNDIPASDLVIQWDICMEMLAVDVNDNHSELFPWKPGGNALERYKNTVKTYSKFIPPETALGLHFCYGDLGHKHFIEPESLANAKLIATESANVIEREIDFCHIPVPRDRYDDAYFEALEDWPSNAGKLYIGLLHLTGGIEGNKRRLDTAKRHINNFGVATECGFGRRAKEDLSELMKIHHEIADLI